MKNFFQGTQTKSTHFTTSWGLGLLGIIVYLVGYAFRGNHWANLDLGEALSHVGFLIAVVTLFHWLIEYRLMVNIVNEAIQTATGSSNLAASGICDFTQDSKTIKYDDEILNSPSLTVCVHYSPRFLEDNFTRLEQRQGNGKKLTIVALKENCASFNYLTSIRNEADHIKPNMKKIRSYVSMLKNKGIDVTLVEHDSILRYSFVMTESAFWIKFYKNAVGHAEIPAIKIRRKTTLGKFFEEDVKAMLGGG
ncbi:MAG: hypothetical protein ABIN69_10100 [Aestuariivirga sp.]